MTDRLRTEPDASLLEGAPTWVRILQAGAIGLAAGLALNVLISLTLSGAGGGPDPAAPRECKKAAPADDAAAPSPATPILGGVTWVFEGFQARR